MGFAQLYSEVFGGSEEEGALVGGVLLGLRPNHKTLESAVWELVRQGHSQDGIPGLGLLSPSDEEMRKMISDLKSGPEWGEAVRLLGFEG